ncbi:MAG: hypothetical protein WC565_01385 [Parcubacteria group bacterium]
MDRLTEKLRLLQNIVPDDDFALSAKFSILASEKPSPSARLAFPKFWIGSVVMAATILVILLIGDIKPPSVTKSVSEIASIDSVAASFEADIDITLKEIRSYGESAEKTSVALYEASSNGPTHMNSSLIKKEFDTLNVTLPDPDEANRLLEQALF